MKTTNSKLQKTELISLTFLTALFATVFTLNSQAKAIEKVTKSHAGVEDFAELIHAEDEASITIENWMLAESNFTYDYELEADNEASLDLESWMTSSEMFAAAYVMATETEEALIVEEWMLAEASFSPSFFIEAETEESMELESWMLNAGSFAIAMNLENEAEEALILEDWMINESAFLPALAMEVEADSKLELETWMLNDSTFKTISFEVEESDEMAMNVSDSDENYTTIEYKDKVTGQTFLFKLNEIEEPEMKLERWMVNKKHWNRN